MLDSLRGISNYFRKLFVSLGEKSKKVRPEIWLVLIVLFALFLRLYFFVGIGFNDDSYYLDFASKVFKGEKFVPPSALTWGIRIGVYYPVILFWKIFGINELSTSFYFIILSLGSVCVTYLIGKELFNEKTGLLAAFLLCIFPLNIIYASQIGPDMGFQFLSALSILFLIKSEKYQKMLYPILSGLFLGISYLFKSTVLVILPVLLFFILTNFYKSKIKPRKYFTKKRILSYILILFGFSMIFGLQVIHFHEISGEWFYGEKVRAFSMTHDTNSNWDLMWYPNMMFNLEERYFEWIHDLPLFSFLYYFVVFSSVYLLYKKDVNSVFLISWFLFLFLFFEYGLQFYCTKIMDYCLYSRHPRFLSIFTIPSVLLVSRFFIFDKRKWRKYFSVISVLFLVVTSLFYAYHSHVFMRSAMGDIREITYFIKTLPNKKVYIPNDWDVSKLSFYFQYDDNYIKNLEVYECGKIKCNEPRYKYGDYITDSYVVTWIDPYTWINREQYPEFMKTHPEYWKLLKTIESERYGILENYKTKIYYVP